MSVKTTKDFQDLIRDLAQNGNRNGEQVGENPTPPAAFPLNPTECLTVYLLSLQVCETFREARNRKSCENRVNRFYDLWEETFRLVVDLPPRPEPVSLPKIVSLVHE